MLSIWRCMSYEKVTKKIGKKNLETQEKLGDRGPRERERV